MKMTIRPFVYPPLILPQPLRYDLLVEGADYNTMTRQLKVTDRDGKVTTIQLTERGLRTLRATLKGE